MASRRASGILLNITSLPSKYGIGDFGPGAYKFVDFLVRAGQSYWQILPLNPIKEGISFSPYDTLSAFAGNIFLISPELLRREGLVTKSDFTDVPQFPAGCVDYRLVMSYKKKLLLAVCKLALGRKRKADYERFCLENKDWLDDYACFAALRRHFRHRPWYGWPSQLRDRQSAAVSSAKKTFRDDIEVEKLLQYIFHRQWFSLKAYCNGNGIKVIGDIPFYVAYDSSDMWCHPEIFKLTKAKKVRYVGGVPPDYFSRTGQLWPNPVYDWHTLHKTGYRWWIQRIKHNLGLFDVVRLDHFRGFAGFWQVPAGRRTAKAGKWVRGPGGDFLRKLFKFIPSSNILVEDLGHITPDVRELVKEFSLTNMKVLQFAFDGDPSDNPHLPVNYSKNCVVYTGTHDNNTAKGWFETEADSRKRKRFFDFVGRTVPARRVHWELICLALSSVANVAIVPMQDVLGLGTEARMNRPSTTKGNWRWRLQPGQMTGRLADKLAKLTQVYGRT